MSNGVLWLFFRWISLWPSVQHLVAESEQDSKPLANACVLETPQFLSGLRIWVISQFLEATSRNLWAMVMNHYTTHHVPCAQLNNVSKWSVFNPHNVVPSFSRTDFPAHFNVIIPNMIVYKIYSKKTAKTGRFYSSHCSWVKVCWWGVFPLGTSHELRFATPQPSPVVVQVLLEPCHLLAGRKLLAETN